ncbi:MAG: sigma-70 family RNA polymerase sigma factor [Cyclobacteriaceae bacterium]|nr:sigma-70 family RNA polymerase sigma factor [Cyclobacteriaceae bacterium]
MAERFILSDQELIKGCVKGERASQEALYSRYCRKMMVICQRYAKSTLEAEDILQEGFIKVFAAIETFRGEAQLNTWITRIMINTALNHQRQKLYLLPMVDVANTNLHETEEVSLADFNLAELIAMIQSLPDGARVVFNLFAIEGYNHKEIAAMLDISEGTSKSQYSRAKSLLKSKLENVSVYGKFGEAKI